MMSKSKLALVRTLSSIDQALEILGAHSKMMQIQLAPSVVFKYEEKDIAEICKMQGIGFDVALFRASLQDLCNKRKANFDTVEELKRKLDAEIDVMLDAVSSALESTIPVPPRAPVAP